MLRKEISAREIRKEYGNYVVAIGYCSRLENYIGRYYNTHFYNQGVNGWNFDVYEINGMAFCYGRRPIGNKKLEHITRKYEIRMGDCEECMRDYWQEGKEEKDKIFEEYCRELKDAVLDGEMNEVQNAIFGKRTDALK